MRDGWLIFSNLALPIIAGVVFFGLARYVVLIAPMRTLMTGEQTYRGAAWGFAFFGAYLITRPVQILLGPHPMPLVINSVREYCMMGLFAPAVFLAMMSLCFGEIPKRLIVSIFGLANVLALAFLVLNARAIGGSEVIFNIGSYAAHDGLWFKNPDPHGQSLMTILFVIRFIDPLFLLLLAGIIVFRHARHYPVERRAVYNNMQTKLYVLSAAVFAFPVSMLITGLLVVLGIPNQWWIYYLGAILSGFLEAASLRLPLRKDVQVSEHL
jgi:hypothetical protein